MVRTLRRGIVYARTLRNRLLKPCPRCEAGKYEKCVTRRKADDGEGNVTIYEVPLNEPHEERYK